MNFQMRKQKKTLHQMKILPLFLLQTASSTLMPKKARKQKTRLQQNQKILILTHSALTKTIQQRLDLKTKPKNLPKELQKMLMQSRKKMTRSLLMKPQKSLLKRLNRRIQTTAKKPKKTKTMKMKVQKQS